MIRLETERLLFRDHEESDLEPFCAMETDPLYRHPRPPRALAEAESIFRETFLPKKPMGLLATAFKPESRYIGYCGLYPQIEDGVAIPGVARLAFYLARDYWGRGLATEAGRAFIDFGFGRLGLTRIVAGANIRNLASNRALQKAGMTWVRSGVGEKHPWHAYEIWNPSVRSIGDEP
jgi:RimJ/RimL family protein N-acetyltransferase